MSVRFDGREIVEWAKGPFDDGAMARTLGSPLSDAPSADTYGAFARQSWVAGWCDEDSALRAGYYATAHVPTLPCGCPLDSGCDSHHGVSR